MGFVIVKSRPKCNPLEDPAHTVFTYVITGKEGPGGQRLKTVTCYCMEKETA